LTVKRIVSVTGRRNSVRASIRSMNKVMKKESPDFLMKIEYFSLLMKERNTLVQDIIANNNVNSGIPRIQIENGKYLKIQQDKIKMKMFIEEKYLDGLCFENLKNLLTFITKFLLTIIVKPFLL